MNQRTTHVGRTARRLAILAVTIVASTGTAAAYGGGSTGGGTMGGSGWGLFGGAMGLWGLLWMGLLVAVLFSVVSAVRDRGSGGNDEQSLSVLRERYARGELSDDEFERRRTQLERTG